MTTDHYAESESLAAAAGSRDSVDRMYATKTDIYLAAIHKSLLAIHDALTAADRYAANEAKQREAGADPLDEDDHRDRLDRHGDIWVRNPRGCFHTRRRDCRDQGCKWTLDFLNEHYGPLAFAPEPPPDAARGDLTASEGESGSVEGDGSHDASKALLCPECGDHINTHNMLGCRFVLCACPRTPEDVARPLIEQAVNIERGGRRG